MTTSADIRGFEYDWVAADAEGYIGLFSTAGGGYAPTTFLEDIAGYDAAIEAILRTAPICDATCVRDLPAGLTNTWKLFAERGFFAFDSDPLGGPYRLVAVPAVPLQLQDLPLGIREVVARIVLPEMRFTGASEIAETDIREARHSKA